MNGKRKNQGAALIMALLLVAIVAGISIALAFSQTVNIQRTIVKETAQQAYLDALYVPQWAKFEISELILKRKQQKEVPVWPQIMPEKRMTDGSVVNAKFLPANGRFNINDLAQPVSAYFTVFSQLLQVVDPNINSDQAKKITQNVQQWLLPAGQVPQNGNDYARMDPPYQVAHRKMVSSSELRLVAGINAALYRRLRPYIIALPATNVPIDLNSASKMMLMSLLHGDESAADAVIQFRKSKHGFINSDQFFGLASVKPLVQQGDKKNPFQDLVSVEMPAYYLIMTQIKRHKLNFHVISILQFSTKTKKIGIIRSGTSL